MDATTTPSTLGPPASPQAMESGLGPLLRYSLVLFRRNVWLIGAIVALFVAIAVVLTMLQTPLYTAASTVEINEQADTVLGEELESQDNSDSSWDIDLFLNTQLEILRSRALAERVVRRLNLAANERFFAAMQDPDMSASSERRADRRGDRHGARQPQRRPSAQHPRGLDLVHQRRSAGFRRRRQCLCGRIHPGEPAAQVRQLGLCAQLRGRAARRDPGAPRRVRTRAQCLRPPGRPDPHARSQQRRGEQRRKRDRVEPDAAQPGRQCRPGRAHRGRSALELPSARSRYSPRRRCCRTSPCRT